MMRAVVVRAPGGGPETLEVRELEEPRATGSLVLIEVHATALNRADLLQRRGGYPPPPGESEILGLECAGVVTEVGPEVKKVELGDRVMALVGSGGYAEKVAVHERLLLPIPDRLSFTEAAAVPEAFLTAYEALLHVAALSPGERVLVHAGASGVGTAAIQIAREIGASVVATTRSAMKIEFLQELGVERAIDTSKEDFTEIVHEISGGAGIDVILDLVGGGYFEKNQAALATGGRWVILGLMSGARGSLDLKQLLFRRQALHGMVMRTRPLPEKTAIVRGFSQDLWAWLAEGRLNPVIDCVLPLQSVAQAHQRMESNENRGKIVLSVR